MKSLYKFMVVTAFITGMVCLSLAGCNKGKPRPADMPDVVPCTISIKLAGQPLAEALIYMKQKNAKDAKWYFSGTTDASGKAVMKTQGNFNGVPQGEYSVMVMKDQLDPNWKPNPKNPDAAQGTISVVNAKYATEQTSPLKCTVGDGNNAFDFNVD